MLYTPGPREETSVECGQEEVESIFMRKLKIKSSSDVMTGCKTTQSNYCEETTDLLKGQKTGFT